MPPHQQADPLRHAVTDVLKACQSEFQCPPWFRYPGTTKGHCFWRMGNGEYYRYKWECWFVTLHPAQRDVYKRAFPPPPSWNEPPFTYYDVIEENSDATDDVCATASLALEMDRTLWTTDGFPPHNDDSRLHFDASLPTVHFDNRVVCVDKKECVNDAACLSARFCMAPLPTSAATNGVVPLFHEGSGGLTDNFGSVQDYLVFRAQELRTNNLDPKEFGKDALTARFEPQSHEFERLDALDEAVVATLDPAQWNALFFSAVADASFLKFSQDKALREYLLHSTGNARLQCDDDLDAANVCGRSVTTMRPDKSLMENVFGKALMMARDSIRCVFAYQDIFPLENTDS